MIGGTVAVVKEFQYLWSVMEATGGMNGRLNFALCGLLGLLEACVYRSSPKFGDQEIGVSLCSARCVVTWSTNLGPQTGLVKKLEKFQHCCIRHILGVRRTVQWAKYITSTQLAERFGM